MVLLMSWTLCSGSMVSGQRRMQGANTMARALADILLVSSCSAILRHNTIYNPVNPDADLYRVRHPSPPNTRQDSSGEEKQRENKNTY